jgi:hypothetical protein
LGRVIQYLAIAAPGAALTIMSAWWTLASIGGGGLWPPDRVNLAEAIATRNNAEALRLIEHGADPNRPERVRDGLLTNGYDVEVRPVEAAVAAQRADSLRMLLSNGASVDEVELKVLRCLEAQRHDSGVRELLEAQEHATVECDGVRLPTDKTR